MARNRVVPKTKSLAENMESEGLVGDNIADVTVFEIIDFEVNDKTTLKPNTMHILEVKGFPNLRASANAKHFAGRLRFISGGVLFGHRRDLIDLIDRISKSNMYNDGVQFTIGTVMEFYHLRSVSSRIVAKKIVRFKMAMREAKTPEEVMKLARSFR